MSLVELGLITLVAVIILIALFRLILGLFFLFFGGVTAVVIFYWIKFNGIDSRSLAVLSGIIGAFVLVSALKVMAHKKHKRRE